MAADGDLLSTLGDDPNLVVEVAVGHEGWRHGEITLALGGGADVNVRRRRSGEEREWRASLGPDRTRALGERLADLGRAGIAPNAETVDPDDEPVRLTVRRDGATVYEAFLRHSQRFESPDLDGVLAQWEQVVGEVSDGELPYGPEKA
jgi:hypothetical protein